MIVKKINTIISGNNGKLKAPAVFSAGFQNRYRAVQNGTERTTAVQKPEIE